MRTFITFLLSRTAVTATALLFDKFVTSRNSENIFIPMMYDLEATKGIRYSDGRIKNSGYKNLY